MQILIAGGSGFLGSALRDFLESQGHTVTILSRNAADTRYAFWNPSKKIIDESAFGKAEVLINLSGENIAGKRWTQKRKDAIISSRVIPAKFLADCLQKVPNRVHTVIQASAIGCYGYQTEGVVTETSAIQDDFLSATCKMWESGALEMAGPGRRVIIARIGIVLSLQSGFLFETLKPAKFGIVPVFGNGRQHVSWITVTDICNVFSHFINNYQLEGTYNLVAPEISSQGEIVRIAATYLKHHPITVNLPKSLMKLLLGEMANLVYSDQQVRSVKLQATGFQFDHNAIQPAIQYLMHEQIKN